MKPSNFTNFLEAGALLRSGPNHWFLLEGPFEQKVERLPGETALFLPDFFSDQTLRYWIPKSFYRLNTQDLANLCAQEISTLLSPFPWNEADFESFKISFKSILERIHQGDLKKAVPIVFEKSTERLSRQRLVSMLQSLLKAPESLYVYGFWQDGEGLLGATPEVLLRQSGQTLRTMALAGTCPKTDVAQRTALLEDPKERLEHDLVVQDILQSLKNYGNLTTTGPQILELPTLYHLKTDIECQLPAKRDFSFFEVCQRLHPTPALGISPRSFGYEWLRSLPEQKERKSFGAPWGLQWSETEALCLVAIRNIQWDRTGSRIGSGCGIVAQSNLQQEWKELFQKRHSVKKIMGLES